MSKQPPKKPKAEPKIEVPKASAPHRISAVFTGAVFTVQFALEGEEVDMGVDPADGNWKTIVYSQFPVVGDLDVLLFARGLNGTAWKLVLNIDDVSLTREGVVRKGFAFLAEQIDIAAAAKAAKEEAAKAKKEKEA